MGLFNRKQKVEDETILKPSADQVIFDLKETQGDAVNKETILKAISILEKYREGKTNLEKRIIANEDPKIPHFPLPGQPLQDPFCHTPDTALYLYTRPSCRQ